MYLCSNWVRTRAARVISVVRSGVGGDVLEGGPALGEQGESSFSGRGVVRDRHPVRDA